MRVRGFSPAVRVAAVATAAIAVVYVIGAVLLNLVVVLSGHVPRDHQVEQDRADDVDDRDGRRRDRRDPDRGTEPSDSHAGVIR